VAFFRNDTVNLLNLHYGIHSLAISGGGAFFSVFLLRAGVPAPIVLAALAAILAGRFVLRPLVLVAAKRWGLKPLVIAGALFSAAQYPLLAQVHGVGAPLSALCAVSAIGDTVYWTAYHAYFASVGDAEHRGHQIAAREALAAIVGIVGPLVTGWALVALGPGVAFGATGLVVALAALPLLATPNIPVLRVAPGSVRAAYLGVLLIGADAWSCAGYFFVWQIALFISLGENFLAFGGAMALAALVGAAGGLLLGRLIDGGHGARAVWLAAGAQGVTILARALAYDRPVWAVAANAMGVLVVAFYTPTLMTVVYNQAKGSPCALRFHMATEGAWDAGGALGCLACAALLWAGAPFGAAILLSFLGMAATFVLLRRHYGDRAPMLGAVVG